MNTLMLKQEGELRWDVRSKGKNGFSYRVLTASFYYQKWYIERVHGCAGSGFEVEKGNKFVELEN